ncbi:Cell division protein 6 [Spironucleus salmonicida]|uniref:Cell division protein 6 n=1 Tax=Spironucleus salmonicida TaxID=348837 RepID=V6LVU1_9EUKA|nr:Cell division protein 6 [Spironucleus salmonicida]|eukprot:EST44939.1 Cell division protein 6 [Spironucleus salmonicida]
MTNIQEKLNSSEFHEAPRQLQLDELKQTFSQTKPQQTFISGNPGTGKSAAITLLIPKKALLVNCAKTPNNTIFKQLSKSSKSEIAAYKLLPGKTLVFDEADFLSNKKLYQILELKSNVILIANSLSFFENDQRLSSRAHNLKQIIFNDYKADEFVEIARFKTKDHFPLPVLKLGAQKILNRAGDLRDYFDFLIRINYSRKLTLEGVTLILGQHKPEFFTKEMKKFMGYFVQKTSFLTPFLGFQSISQNHQRLNYLKEMNAVTINHDLFTAQIAIDKRLLE